MTMNVRERIEKASAERTLYFGYGSNLNAIDYGNGHNGVRRKPLSFICRALAPDVSLVFDQHSHGRAGGVLSLKDTSGGVVEGALFDVPGWDELDEKEGVQPDSHGTRAYTRLAIPVLVYSEKAGIWEERIAQSYVTTVPGEFFIPSASYFEICLSGRDELHIGTSDLKAASNNTSNGFSSANHRVFTYGTLCRGESREHVMRSGPLDAVIPATVQGMELFRHGSGAFPCLMRARPDRFDTRPVSGDVWSYRTLFEDDFESISTVFVVMDRIEDDIRPTLREQVVFAQEAIQEGNDIDAASEMTRNCLARAIMHSMYRRTLVDVSTGESQCRAWIYIYKASMAGFELIADGNWRARSGN
jgi:gamma-glutamylcyclotransferase (GGCT)/AIG2-like uncharacterized protein YtfP